MLAILAIAGSSDGVAAQTADTSIGLTAMDDTDRTPTFEATLAVGAGIAQRNVEIPTRAGRRRLDTDAFPALELALRGEFRLTDRVSLGIESHYQTSVGVIASETIQNNIRAQSTLRSHHGDLGVITAIRFGSLPRASLRVFAGWALRGLRSTTRLTVPGYTLHGPIVRPEVEFSIVGGVVGLRLGPELILLAGVGRDFRDLGSTASTGFGIGGQGSVVLRIAPLLELGVAYRESHAFVSTAWNTDARDSERYVTAHAALRY